VIPNQPPPPLNEMPRESPMPEMTPPRSTKKPPFHKRYRLSKSVYRRDYPHLAPSDNDLRKLERSFRG
jgi:hypothetical protein